MLTLTRRTEYALMALTYMSRLSQDEVASAREIAESHGIPTPLLMNILKDLNQCSLVRSLRGARGGYALACSLSEISLADLIEKLEGPLRLVRCADDSAESADNCDLECRCSVRSPLMKVHARIKSLLQQVTLAELAEPGVECNDQPAAPGPVQLRGRLNESANLPR